MFLYINTTLLPFFYNIAVQQYMDHFTLYDVEWQGHEMFPRFYITHRIIVIPRWLVKVHDDLLVIPTTVSCRQASICNW